MRRLVVLALSCVAVTACGGGGESSEGSSDVQRAIEPAAQERAESMLLTLSDFPDGWRAEEPAEEGEESEEAFRRCVGADFSGFTVVGDARSDEFAMEEARASSGARVFETEEMAAAAVAEFSEGFSSDEADTCMNEFLQKSDDELFRFTEADAGELSFAPPSGVDDASAWQVVVTVEGKPGTQAADYSVEAYFDFVQLRAGDTVSEMTTADVRSPFDPALRDELVAAVAERLTD